MANAKHLEDLIRSYNERNPISENEEYTPGPKYVKPLLSCSYCNQSFSSIDERNAHIRANHFGARPLLFINEKIVPNETDRNSISEYYAEEITTAKIDLGTSINIEISVNEEKIKCEGPIINLTPYFKTDEETYTVIIDDRSYKIIRLERSIISNPCINSIINKWEEQIVLKEPLSPWRGDYPSDLNNAEIHYLNGFIDYLTACKEYIDSSDRKKRYNTAFAILSSFNSLPTKGRLVLKVIAFRWDWIKELEALSRFSFGIFDVVIDFFYGRKSKYEINGMSENKEYKVFLESEVAACLDAIIAFQNGDMSDVDDYLGKWTDEDIRENKDNNTKNKILLLKARRLESLGKGAEAKKYFNDIRLPFIENLIIRYSEN